MARDMPRIISPGRPHSNRSKLRRSGLPGALRPQTPGPLETPQFPSRVTNNRNEDKRYCRRYRLLTVNLSSCPPPYGGEQGRKGKGCPNPHAVSLAPFPCYLTAEPQYRSGALKRSQFNAYQFMCVTTPLSGLKGSVRL